MANKKCFHCGKEFSEEFSFCPYCGQEVLVELSHEEILLTDNETPSDVVNINEQNDRLPQKQLHTEKGSGDGQLTEGEKEKRKRAAEEERLAIQRKYSAEHIHSNSGNNSNSNKRKKNNNHGNAVGFFGLLIVIFVVFVVAVNPSKESKAKPQSTSQSGTSSYSSSSSSSGSTSSSFTNLYGTPTTVCAHKGCTNYIASSGDTNCCAIHSNKCLECGKYIDEDATWCMSCLYKATNSSNSSSSSSSSGKSSSKGPWYSTNVKSDGMGPYPCYGKNNTCPNYTYNYKDLYCDKCDPDGDNKEG